MALEWEWDSKAQTEGETQGLVFPLFSRALVPGLSHSGGSHSGALKHLKLRKGNLPL